MAECVCLENRFTSNGDEGSNPSSSDSLSHSTLACQQVEAPARALKVCFPTPDVDFLYEASSKKHVTVAQKPAFTAVGKISPEDPYTFAMSNDFIPWRRNVSFLPSKQVPIQPLLEKLTFI